MSVFFSLLCTDGSGTPLPPPYVPQPEWGVRGVFLGSDDSQSGVTSSAMTISNVTLEYNENNSFVNVFKYGLFRDSVLHGWLESGDNPSLTIWDGGLADNITIEGEYRGSGGSDSGGHYGIYGQSVMIIKNGGRANNSIINNGGSITVENGGVLNGLQAGDDLGGSLRINAYLTVKRGGKALNINRLALFGDVQIIVENGGEINYV